LIKVPLMVLQSVLRRSEPELIRCESSRPDEYEGLMTTYTGVGIEC